MCMCLGCMRVCKPCPSVCAQFHSVYTREPNVSRTASHESARCVWEYCKGKKKRKEKRFLYFPSLRCIHTHGGMKTVYVSEYEQKEAPKQQKARKALFYGYIISFIEIFCNRTSGQPRRELGKSKISFLCNRMDNTWGGEKESHSHFRVAQTFY